MKSRDNRLEGASGLFKQAREIARARLSLSPDATPVENLASAMQAAHKASEVSCLTLTAIRNLSPDIPFVLSSGYDEAHVMSGDHPVCPNAFLGKPYGLQDRWIPSPVRSQDRKRAVIPDSAYAIQKNPAISLGASNDHHR